MTIGALCSLCLAAPAGAAPKAPANPYGKVPTITIAASPNPVVFNAPVTISGSLRSGKKGVHVVLQGRVAIPRGAFSTAGTATTNGHGRYRLMVRPTVNTVYRVISVTSPPGQSADLLVRVRMHVTLRVSRRAVSRGSLVRFSGRVYPPHNGRRIYIQRRTPHGRWRSVGRPRLVSGGASSSRFSRRVRIWRTGFYRAVVLGHSDHAAGYSGVMLITVGR